MPADEPDQPRPPGAPNEAPGDEGVAQAIIRQWTQRELPQLLAIKSRLDAGRELAEGELELLDQVVEHAGELTRLAYLEPRAKALAARMIDLVHEITGEAVDNERDS